MRELLQAIPDVDVVLAMEPEELGAKLLFLARGRQPNDLLHPVGMVTELFDRNQPNAYPRDRRDQVEQAYTEAWAWLEAQGLVVPAAGGNGQNGYRRLSRRARQFEDEAEFKGFATALSLPKPILHPSISKKVWLAFVRGDYDVAVMLAMKRVEIAVREAGGYGQSEIGVPLMRRAFDVENGPLTDRNAVRPEREALQHLFAGAIGSYKNPQSHRDVNLDDPAEAIELILLANHLLRIVDARAASQRHP